MKLLIAYDGSECADSALDDLTHAGLPERGEALVITVAEAWLPPPPPSAFEILEMARTQIIRSSCKVNMRRVIKPSWKLMSWRVSLVLIWVPKKDEAEIKQAFQQTLIVRRLSRAARELADRYFYETVVRIHRTGEGEPYTGLRPAGTDLSPVIPVADKAIQTGSVELLLKLFPDDFKGEIQKRFSDTIKKKKFIKTDIEAGRKYVGAYIGLIHYLEHLYEHKSEKVVLKHGEGA